MDAQKEPSPDTQKPQRSRCRRALLVLLVVVIVIGVGAPVVWYQLGGKLRYTQPYKAAMALLEKDPQVRQQLGAPIRNASILGLPSGSVFGENANLVFKIGGPKGKAAVRADARVIGGQWAVRALEVTCADGKRISVNTSAGGGDDAPQWTPAPGADPTTPKEPAKEAPKAAAPASPGPNLQFDLPDLGPAEKGPAEGK